MADRHPMTKHDVGCHTGCYKNSAALELFLECQAQTMAYEVVQAQKQLVESHHR